MSDEKAEQVEHMVEDALKQQEELKDYSPQLASPPAPSDTDQIVESWWDSHVRGSIVGQSTQIWNHLMVCKDHLKAALRGR